MSRKAIIRGIVIGAFSVALFFAVTILPVPFVSAQSKQDSSAGQSSMPGMDMGDMQGMEKNTDAAKAAASDMSDEDMGDMKGMDAHMHMTDLRPANAADQKRAEEILAQLRPAIEKYKDYHVALADNFRIFGPKVPQPIYHFTNYRYGAIAGFKFDPTRPTSLLYKKTDTGYELVGVMYTAPRRFSEEQLNARVPLSVARWHQHVNLCLPPLGMKLQDIDFKEFGPSGSIATQTSCDAAGGRWYPVVLGWMVHVYPFERDLSKTWAH